MSSHDDEREVGRVRPGANAAGPAAAPGDPDPFDPDPILSRGPGSLPLVPLPLFHPHPNTLKVLAQTMGERCAEARRRIGHSQRGLAKDMDMSPSWVREYESGGQFPPAWLIVTLAETARLPVGWFYGYGQCQ